MMTEHETRTVSLFMTAVIILLFFIVVTVDFILSNTPLYIYFVTYNGINPKVFIPMLLLSGVFVILGSKRKLFFWLLIPGEFYIFYVLYVKAAYIFDYGAYSLFFIVAAVSLLPKGYYIISRLRN